MYQNEQLNRIFKFGTVGISGVFVNSGLLIIFTELLKVDYRISSITAIEISILNNFLWNSLWTWKDKKTSGRRNSIQRLLKFHTSCIFTAFFINFGLLMLLTEIFHVPYWYSNLVGIAIGSIINYITSHFWVFHRKESGVTLKNEING